MGLDGLEYNCVKEFNLNALMQESSGKTDLSEFSEPRTVVIWSSFLAGKNLENRVLALGKEFWKFKLRPDETFFSKFKKWKAIDVPGFTYKFKNHDREKKLLKKFFDGKVSVEEYDRVAFENHEENKREFLESLNKGYEVLMGYFALADVIGHLSFGLRSKMRLVYEELENLAKKAREACEKVLIISDHGMRAVGRFGDHTTHGFWSFSSKLELSKPRVTDFRELIEKL